MASVLPFSICWTPTLHLHDHFLPDHFSHRRLIPVRDFAQSPEQLDYQLLSKIPIASFPLLWATIYNEFYSALSKSEKLDTEDVVYWLNYARGFVDPSQCIAFKEFTELSPPRFFDDEFTSPILHLLYFFSKFMTDPTKRPPMSPGRHVFAIGAAIQQLSFIVLLVNQKN